MKHRITHTDAVGHSLVGSVFNSQGLVLVFDNGYVELTAQEDFNGPEVFENFHRGPIEFDSRWGGEGSRDLLVAAGIGTADEFDAARDAALNQAISIRELNERRDYELLRRKFDPEYKPGCAARDVEDFK